MIGASEIDSMSWKGLSYIDFPNPHLHSIEFGSPSSDYDDFFTFSAS